jgi:hypothetical protein
MSGKKEGDRDAKSRGRGRSGNKTTTTSSQSVTKAKGACEALGTHTFEYGQRGSADQMRITFKEIIKYVGNTYGIHMTSELRARTTVVIPEPKESKETLDRLAEATADRKDLHDHLQAARRARLVVLKAGTGNEYEIALLEGEMKKAEADLKIPLPAQRSISDQTIYLTQSKAYGIETQHLTTHRGKVKVELLVLAPNSSSQEWVLIRGNIFDRNLVRIARCMRRTSQETAWSRGLLVPSVWATVAMFKGGINSSAFAQAASLRGVAGQLCRCLRM